MSHIQIVYYSSGESTHQLAEAIRDGASEYGPARLLRILPQHIRHGRYPIQAFADASSAGWCRQAWADKIAAGFTIGGNLNGDQQCTLACFATLAAQHGMLWCGLDIAAGHGPEGLNRLGCQLGATAHSPDGKLHPSDLATARYLGRRVARLAQRMRASALTEEPQT
ncbi:flavodoxin family protein [Chromobacterium violaceum]|uniref:flavodoxin family protein n=1 Tax=Chromobacterium violaceum TaxID=536 RepID=UPI001B328B81|nr:flavodoxin family protein [Chromobacterium violaceum]MBP4044486.1 flavodoxin family protein [Chromobacterium violaceum]